MLPLTNEKLAVMISFIELLATQALPGDEDNVDMLAIVKDARDNLDDQECEPEEAVLAAASNSFLIDQVSDYFEAIKEARKFMGVS